MSTYNASHTYNLRPAIVKPKILCPLRAWGIEHECEDPGINTKAQRLYAWIMYAIGMDDLSISMLDEAIPKSGRIGRLSMEVLRQDCVKTRDLNLAMARKFPNADGVNPR